MALRRSRTDTVKKVMCNMNSSIDCISDFIFVNTALESADVILIPGGSQPQPIEAAADLYHQGFAPFILPSGGLNPRLVHHRTEWEFMNDLATSLGVPEEAILCEDKAQNTFDNANFSRDVLIQQGISVSKAILVCKGFHSRRALLTYQSCFPPEVEFMVQSVQDRRGISRETWYLESEFIATVMGEVRKIGSYFENHIPHLAGMSQEGEL